MSHVKSVLCAKGIFALPIPVNWLTLFPLCLLAILVGCSTVPQAYTDEWIEKYYRIADVRGWRTNYARGREIIRELSAMTPGEQRQLPIGAYREGDVALVGKTAPPGGEDLFTEEGFFLRLRYPKGTEPPERPYIWHVIMVKGRILQVLPENKIIVFEVQEEQFIESG